MIKVRKIFNSIAFGITIDITYTPLIDLWKEEKEPRVNDKLGDTEPSKELVR